MITRSLINIYKRSIGLYAKEVYEYDLISVENVKMKNRNEAAAD